MFRDTGNAKMSKDTVGVGSTVKGNFDSEDYMFVCIGDKSVGLLNLQTMIIDGKSVVSVEDINYISSAEARNILNSLGNKLNWTFTDFEIIPKGLKRV